MTTDMYCHVDGPDGALVVAFNRRGISAVVPDDHSARQQLESILGRPVVGAERPPHGLVEALASGDGSQLSYDLLHLSPFSQAVLRATLEIPVGETRSYGQLAAEVGHPGAARGVGSVMRRNPIPVLIPCHRVVRSDGSIGDYSGGGPQRKRALLRQEAARAAAAAMPQRRTTRVSTRPTIMSAALTSA